MTTRNIFLILLALVFLGLLAWIIFNSRAGQEDLTGEPTPVPTFEVSPTPESLSLAGEVASISAEPVGFLNARVITTEAGTSLYITESTEITDLEDEDVDFDDIEVGDNVSAQGTPTEGGILVERLIVQTGGSTSVTPTTTPRTSPTPSPSPRP